MVDVQRQRIEQEMTKMINDLDLQYLRKMQADMHRCAANCCVNRNVSLERVQKCVDNCSATINWAQTYVQKEFEIFQNRLQRCVMDCNDDVRQKMGPDPSNSEVIMKHLDHAIFHFLVFRSLNSQQFLKLVQQSVLIDNLSICPLY